jgi:hypothetical protein
MTPSRSVERIRGQLAFAIPAFVLIAAATSARTGAPQRAEPNSIAFVHAAVIDATGAPTRPDQTILISGDRIAAVAPSASTPIPNGTRTIDATGKFLIPGLWDAHVHTRYEGIDHLRLLVVNGITSTRNMSAPWEHLSEIHKWQQQIANGERVGPHILTAGPVLDGNAGRSTTLVVTTVDEAQRAVQQMKLAGADFVKVYNLLRRDTFVAIAAEAKAQGLPFVGHCHSRFLSMTRPTPVSFPLNTWTAFFGHPQRRRNRSGGKHRTFVLRGLVRRVRCQPNSYGTRSASQN